MTDLNDEQQAILDLEGRLPVYGLEKDRAIRVLGFTPSGYFQALNALADNPAAEQYAPATIHRVRRIRDDRQHGRERINRG